MSQRAVFLHTRAEAVGSRGAPGRACGILVVAEPSPLPGRGLAGADPAAAPHRRGGPARDARRLDTDPGAVPPPSGRSAEVMEGRQFSGGAQPIEAGRHGPDGPVPGGDVSWVGEALLKEARHGGDFLPRLTLQPTGVAVLRHLRRSLRLRLRRSWRR